MFMARPSQIYAGSQQKQSGIQQCQVSDQMTKAHLHSTIFSSESMKFNLMKFQAITNATNEDL